MVRSGTCVVDVCSSVDMGDYTFRYYAKEPTATALQFIPKGGCQCKAVRLTKLKRDFVTFDAVGEDGNTLRLISVVSTGRRQHQPTTIQKFDEKRSRLQEIEGFNPGGDSLASFRIYRSRDPIGAKTYDYFLVPRDRTFSFRGESQKIAFNVPLGVREGGALPYEHGDRTPQFSAVVSLYGTIRVFQFFNPRRLSSDRWNDVLELSAQIADTRLFPKN
jgi:hypothetical protein